MNNIVPLRSEKKCANKVFRAIKSDNAFQKRVKYCKTC